jgi:hypothetical protein
VSEHAHDGTFRFDFTFDLVAGVTWTNKLPIRAVYVPLALETSFIHDLDTFYLSTRVHSQPVSLVHRTIDQPCKCNRTITDPSQEYHMFAYWRCLSSMAGPVKKFAKLAMTTNHCQTWRHSARTQQRWQARRNSFGPITGPEPCLSSFRSPVQW